MVLPQAPLAQFLAVDDDGIGGTVVGQDNAVAIQNPTTESRDLDAANALERLRGTIAGTVEHLHVPEAPGQQAKPGDEEPEEEPELPGPNKGWRGATVLNLHGRPPR